MTSLTSENNNNNDELNDLNFVSITPDDGVKKIILRHTADEKDGGEKVKNGEMCTVNYTGFLERNGEEFDSTAYSSAFKFQVGKGQVVKGFDIAVLSMQVGEISKFILTSNYAYGQEGSKGKGMAPDILPGDSLIFQIELLSSNQKEENLTAAELRLLEEQKRLEDLKILREAKKKEAEEKKLEKIRLKEKAAQLKKEKDAKNQKKKGKKKSNADDIDLTKLDKKTIKKMKPNDLKNVLKKLGLSTQGNKKELIKRVESSLQG